MHLAVYIFAALVVLGGFALASELQHPLSIIVVVQTLFSGVLLATFGRIEEHLGHLVAIARHAGSNEAASVLAVTRDDSSEESNELMLTRSDSISETIVETGQVMDREFKRFKDGSVEIQTLMGPKRFRTMNEAIAYLR